MDARLGRHLPEASRLRVSESCLTWDRRHAAVVGSAVPYASGLRLPTHGVRRYLKISGALMDCLLGVMVQLRASTSSSG
jgi:hypothetical protein